jgi:hypothetical protein
MDPLDRLAAPAADLLDRVDAALAERGAPDDHRIWPLLRRLRALPGPAVEAVVALRPAPLAAAGTALRGLIREYDDLCRPLRDPVSWEGAAADVFDSHRAGLVAHLIDGPESLAGRLDANAAYAEAIADWMTGSRASLARTLAEVLGSAEAVTVVVGTGGNAGAGSAVSGARAAAEIGARVLVTIADAYDRAETLLHRWTAELTEVDVLADSWPSAATAGGTGAGSTIRLAL